MKYTKNQHVLSQWVLRNFRSDDTANKPKDKQRVWCHTVYHSEKRENDIKEIPLPISSIALCKDCFMLVDVETGKKFDIENELSEYENRTSVLFNKLIHEHSFELLLDVNRKNSSLEVILNFIMIQMVLNLHNPQNKMDDKEEFFDSLIKEVVENIDGITQQINNPPEEFLEFFELPIYKKIVRVANSSSDSNAKCKALFTLFMLVESLGLPSLVNFLSTVRNKMFKGIYITGIYHTGHDFDSTELRPVFTIGPNVFSHFEQYNTIYLPLAHNLAISFSVGQHRYFNDSVNVFSPNPEKLRCKSSQIIKIFCASFDFIDNITSLITMGNQGHSKTIYTPYELKDIEAYLKLQNENMELFYSPDEPEFVVV